MSGEPIEAVKNGIQILVSTLRQDPYALETAYLSIITFGSTAKQLVPLTELSAFQQPSISASGTTALGEALCLLASKIETEVVKTTPDTKGDWKPLVFLMTDGSPTDDIRKGIDALKNVKTGVIIACAAGSSADTATLKQITEVVVGLDTADADTMKAFFKWVSASVTTGSQRVDQGQKEIGGLDDLPPPPSEINIVV
jgi:uncharacterized protein YegL